MSQAMKSRISQSLVTFVTGGYELTHFVDVQSGERRQGLQGDNHIMDNGQRRLCALAVSKFFIPFELNALRRVLPLGDEAGAVEALDEHNHVFRVILHEGQRERLLAPPQPFSTPLAKPTKP